jgi:hypothetical protein|tara:strand:- start:542 stop:655 length:114 start_codon:yes stop_codon:yes gene_type:complete
MKLITKILDPVFNFFDWIREKIYEIKRGPVQTIKRKK